MLILLVNKIQRLVWIVLNTELYIIMSFMNE